eukprot:TRINITY_DN10428_c0_g1_i1.p1 TRINITY_DN10428_c0_g1~~TRINITY_DN10428_c0_g1_i1.p1  ORF type:complete len:542 (+),score=120.28 TRINITY_DN10428_c0_g1_i1:238-1863(+)
MLSAVGVPPFRGDQILRTTPQPSRPHSACHCASFTTSSNLFDQLPRSDMIPAACHPHPRLNLGARVLLLLLLHLHLVAGSSQQSLSQSLTLSVDTTTVLSRTSPMIASFNFDWHENNEEYPYWVNSSALKIDLDAPLLRAAASAMSPAVLRVGGSEGDVLCYDVAEFGSSCASMNQTDPNMCLTMPRYEQLVGFAKETGLKLVFGLNAIWGRPGHNTSLPLSMKNIRALLAYTAKHGLSVYGFELGNEEPTISPAVMAADYHALHQLLTEYWPSKEGRPLLIGNDCNTDPKYLDQFLPLVSGILDVVTYHRYDGYGLDPDLARKIMTPSFLNSTISTDLNQVHAHRAPNSQLWVGEAAAAWHSGAAGVTDAFTSSFWWADALGAVSAHNHTVYCRQTLLGGNYGLLNRTSFVPFPDYYVARLFHDLMGDIALAVQGTAGHESLRAYAHCNRDGPGVTLLLVNISPDVAFSVGDLGPRQEWVLSATELGSHTVMLNGLALEVRDGALPQMDPVKESGVLTVAPETITFSSFPPSSPYSVCRG